MFVIHNFTTTIYFDYTSSIFDNLWWTHTHLLQYSKSLPRGKHYFPPPFCSFRL